MSSKNKNNLYSVAGGATTVIFTGASGWNKCERSVHRFRHAFYKSFPKNWWCCRTLTIDPETLGGEQAV